MNEKRTKIKKKMRDSLVTVIIPCYNQERTIGEAIESVLAQTFQDYEVIVVNDGSTDGSLSVIENYVRNYPNKVRYINQENQGVVSARNNAIAQSLVSGGGGYIFPLDGDDRIAPECLRKLYEAMIQNKGDVIYCDAEWLGGKAGRIHYRRATKFNMCCSAIPVSALYRKADWVRYGGYDKAMNKGLEDWEFWLNFVEDNKRFYKVEEPLFCIRYSSSSRQNSIPESDKEALFRYVKMKHKKLFGWKFVVKRMWLKFIRFFYQKKITNSGKVMVKIIKIPVCRYNEKDYIRNYEEFLSLIRNKWNVKYAKYGASNFGQYTARRLSRHINDIVRYFRCMIISVSWWFRKSAIKYHKNFVSLGYNCELAYRYNLNNGFVDSGLFQWGYSCSCDDLIFALNHLDFLFTGEILDPTPLYECANTHIRQHGKSPMSLWMKGGAGTSEQKEADKAELVGRIRYLKEKFVNTLYEGGALVMYKMRSAEALAPNAAEKVRTILATLKKLGAKEFDFVLVLENKCRGRLQFDKSERVYVRYVKEFNPDEDVSNKRIGDFYGWKCIFNEFRFAQKKKNAHKFKFEK